MLIKTIVAPRYRLVLGACLEYAATTLGNKDIDTSQIYAQMRREKAIEAARRLG